MSVIQTTLQSPGDVNFICKMSNSQYDEWFKEKKKKERNTMYNLNWEIRT